MPPLVLDFTIGADGRLLDEVSGGLPDVEITLPSSAPFLALQGGDRLMGAAHITGSAEFADALGFVLRNLRWDIEEDLSKAVGDIAAHRIVASFEAFAGWQRQAVTNLTENLSEYFAQERPSLVKQAEVSAFADEVGKLNEDLSRLEQRIQRLAD
jgi:ubiquinone biosynthesis protein UbiJ